MVISRYWGSQTKRRGSTVGCYGVLTKRCDLNVGNSEDLCSLLRISVSADSLASLLLLALVLESAWNRGPW